MAALSVEQFQQLLAAITPAPPAAPNDAAQAAQASNDPNALGPMPPCVLTSEKISRLRQFETWLEEAENRMKFIGVDDDQKKVILLRSWGGAELVKFMKSHAKVKFEVTPADGGTAAIPADTYEEVVTKIKDELRKMVNRTMAMYQLFTTKQGDRNWMDFVRVLEDKAHVLDFAALPYTEKDAVKDAAIFGMSDEKLQEKALADDPTLEALIRMGQSRETGREGVHQLKDNKSNVSRVAPKELSNAEIDSQIQTQKARSIQWTTQPIAKQR